MQVTETIPSVVTWPEIKAHCRLDDTDELTYLTSLSLACTEAFERETGYAAGTRTISVVYSDDDLTNGGGCTNCRRNRSLAWSYIKLPKGPAESITSITPTGGSALPTTAYELRKQGHTSYLYLKTAVVAPITVVYVAGSEVVPQLIKQGVLIHTETLRNNRGATSTQQQYVLANGLDRIYDQFRTNKALAG